MPHFAASIPILIAPLISGLAIWSSLSVRAAHRANGRRAVEAELKRLGERAVTIENVPTHTLADRAGLSGAYVFRIAARTTDGAARTHLWAYEPGLLTTGRPLKRLAHGIWIPA